MDLPRFHRLRPAYYRLQGQQCVSCGAIQFPSRMACSSCGGNELDNYMLSGSGTVHSYSEVAQTPEGFEPPNLMALVRLDEGILVAAQLTDVDPDEVEIGIPVEMVTRRIRDHGPHGFLVYGYKFRPVVSRRAAS
jgi:uncharacterized OB-fold protein